MPKPECCGNDLGQEWVRFGEGQHTCLDCLATIVRNTADAQPLYDDVLALYAHLNMPLPTRPPLMLVRRDSCQGTDTVASVPDQSVVQADPLHTHSFPCSW